MADTTAFPTEAEEDPKPVTTDDVPLNVEPEGRERSKSKVEEVMEKIGGTVPVIFIGSLMVMIQSSRLCYDGFECTKEYGFAVAAGTISTAACLVYLVMHRMKPESIPPKTTTYMAIFMAVWWTVGVAVLTFDSPFTGFDRANGYIGIWLCFVMSLKMLTENVARAKGGLNAFFAKVTPDAHGAAFMLLVFASVMLASSIQPATTPSGLKPTDTEVWALVASSCTIVFALICLLLARQIGSGMRFFTAFVVLWTMGGALTTFFGPFMQAGNGYFSAFGCLFTSMYMFNAYSA